MNIFSVLLIAATANAFSQILLKLAVTDIGSKQYKNGIEKIKSVAVNANFWLGTILFLVSLSIYIYMLGEHEITRIFPSMAMTFVFVVILSSKILGERMNFWRISGVFSILIGSVLLSFVGE